MSDRLDTSDPEIRRTAFRIIGPYFGGAGLILTAIIAGIGMLGMFTAALSLITCGTLLAIPFIPERSRLSSVMPAMAFALVAVTLIQSSLASNGITNSGAYLVCALPIAASILLGYRSALVFLAISVLFAIACVIKYHFSPSAEELALASGQIYSKTGFYLVATLGAFATALVFMSRTRNALEKLRDAERHASRAAEQAREAQAEAERAAEAKSMFLANMSHEIRTPLNGVLGMAQILESKDVREDQKEMVDAILESGQMLRAIVDDVLDLSKIDSGRVELMRSDSDFHETLRYVTTLFETAAREKGLSFEYSIDENLPRWLNIDALRLRQVLSNLVSNAVKFTSKGSVKIHASADGDAARGYILSVRIEDTGPGIRHGQIETLFEAFCQADNSPARRFGGTGLGLTIARKLARLMGGDITVSTVPGQGSVFMLTFRAAAAHSPKTAASRTDSMEPGLLAGRRILAADDMAVNRAVLRYILEPHGAAIREAADGYEVLDLLAKESFDLLLLDAHMPRLDGIQTIKKIRNSDQPWRTLKVLAITADALTGDREKYLGMGMDGYIAKPIEARPFLREVIRLLENEPDSQADAESAPTT